MRSIFRSFHAVVWLALLGLSASVLGQIVGGSILGTIHDASGAATPKLAQHACSLAMQPDAILRHRCQLVHIR
jgi:hypothetical protein